MFLVKKWSPKEITDREYKLIEENKLNYFTEDRTFFEQSRFPGFFFKNDYVKGSYLSFYYEHFVNCFTPPRGNLLDPKFIVCGYRPGKNTYGHSKAECAWLLGQRSKILHLFLKEINTYPYYTNVYKESNDFDVKSIYITIEEILKINELCDTVPIIFLGQYDEYYEIIKNIPNVCFITWHPSYVSRFNKLKEWIDLFKGIVVNSKY